MLTKAFDGWYPAPAPYGYKNDKDTKTLVRDEIYFKPVQEILAAFSEGVSIPNLANYLYKWSIKTKGSNKRTPRDFKPKDVWKILTKSYFYAGYYDWGEHKGIHGKHEKMITWEQHLKIQSRLYNKNVVNTDLLSKNSFYLNFSIGKNKGFLHCDGCGKRMLSCISKGKLGKRYPYYYCSNSKCNNQKKSIAKQDLEKLFEKQVGRLTPMEELVESFKEETLDLWDKEYKIYENKCKIAQERVDNLEYEKRQTIAMRRRNELTKEEFETEIERIRIDLVGAGVEVEYNLTDRNQLNTLLEQAQLFLTNLEPLYLGFSTDNKQRFAAFLFPKGVRYADGEIRTPEKSYLFTVLDNMKTENFENSLMVTPRRIELRLSA